MTSSVVDDANHNAPYPRARTDAPSTIDLSVIVCTRNRACDLAFMLKALAKAAIPPKTAVEMIVVDNASVDDTKKVVHHAKSAFRCAVIYVYEATKGLSSARNAGIANARGKYIAWTDDDCVVSSDWLEAIVNTFNKNPDISMLGGRVLLYDPTDYPVSIKTSVVPERLSRTITFPGALLYGCNMAFRRSLVDQIGNFDVRFGAGSSLRAAEDAELVYRAFTAGFDVCYAPDVVVYHNHHRKTREQAILVRAGYAFSDGAFLMKYILKGDITALKFFYWRCVNIIRPLLSAPAGNYAPLWHLRLLLEMFLGAATYIRLAIGGALCSRREVYPAVRNSVLTMGLLPHSKKK